MEEQQKIEKAQKKNEELHRQLEHLKATQAGREKDHEEKTSSETVDTHEARRLLIEKYKDMINDAEWREAAAQWRIRRMSSLEDSRQKLEEMRRQDEMLWRNEMVNFEGSGLEREIGHITREIDGLQTFKQFPFTEEMPSYDVPSATSDPDIRSQQTKLGFRIEGLMVPAGVEDSSLTDGLEYEVTDSDSSEINYGATDKLPEVFADINRDPGDDNQVVNEVLSEVPGVISTVTGRWREGEGKISDLHASGKLLLQEPGGDGSMMKTLLYGAESTESACEQLGIDAFLDKSQGNRRKSSVSGDRCADEVRAETAKFAHSEPVTFALTQNESEVFDRADEVEARSIQPRTIGRMTIQSTDYRPGFPEPSTISEEKPADIEVMSLTSLKGTGILGDTSGKNLFATMNKEESGIRASDLNCSGKVIVQEPGGDAKQMKAVLEWEEVEDSTRSCDKGPLPEDEVGEAQRGDLQETEEKSDSEFYNDARENKLIAARKLWALTGEGGCLNGMVEKWAMDANEHDLESEEALPVDVVLKKSVLEPIRRQVELVDRITLAFFLSDLDVFGHILAMRR